MRRSSALDAALRARTFDPASPIVRFALSGKSFRGKTPSQIAGRKISGIWQEHNVKSKVRLIRAIVKAVQYAQLAAVPEKRAKRHAKQALRAAKQSPALVKPFNARARYILIQERAELKRARNRAKLSKRKNYLLPKADGRVYRIVRDVVMDVSVEPLIG